MRCHSCTADAPERSRFCPSCGAPLVDTEGSTLVVPRDEPSSGSREHGRFLPGTILGGRFRIVAMLGRGGMGEVFRADDLKLGQPVALKFLPRAVAGDPKHLERLYAEVRVARQIAHPNVCRVYDIGEVDGEHFLSMEYVEGEDLAALLRRIGRVPESKAIQISWQIAAGLAAAHERGILHRDLKPSNVMLDDRGLVRLTDFGLATVVSELAEPHAIEGTPAYMAPEQLAGEKVTLRSDIYALGLVMYEIFTGKRAFQGESLGDLRQQRHSSTPSPPSDVVPNISPAVERVILRCLDPDPRNRPPSALHVSSALPGGDPLAAAIAAGETPSPDMLAAASDPGAMKVSRALACLATVIVSLLVIAMANRTRSLAAFIRPQQGEVLASRAADVARRLGYPQQPYRAYGFSTNEEYIKHVAQTDKSVGRWERLRRRHPSPVLFWYRESPRPIIAREHLAGSRPSVSDPPPRWSGEFVAILDSAGALESFNAPTPEVLAPETPKPMDWNLLAEAAQLDLRSWNEKSPKWAPLAWGDMRAAREGFSPEHPDIPLRAEAASNAGRLIYFEIIPPWKGEMRSVSDPRLPIPARILMSIFVTVVLALFGGTAFLARRNFRLGRGDRRGAFRLGFAVFSLVLAADLLDANHYPEVAELDVLSKELPGPLLLAAFAWMFYVAIEPYARRLWPHSLVSWNRALLGQFRDPLVGRHLLVGTAAGIVVQAAATSVDAAIEVRWTPERPSMFRDEFLLGVPHWLAAIPGCAATAVFLSFTFFSLLFIARLVSRSNVVAVTLVAAIFGISGAFSNEHHAVGALVAMISFATFAFLVIDVGIVAGIAWGFTASLVDGGFPMLLDSGSWAIGPTLFAMGVLLALAFYAFRIALAGRPVFDAAILKT